MIQLVVNCNPSGIWKVGIFLMEHLDATREEIKKTIYTNETFQVLNPILDFQDSYGLSHMNFVGVLYAHHSFYFQTHHSFYFEFPKGHIGR